jgi:tRNA uridine 5-carboxymethylaminomethyl modification enzyme
MGSTPVAQRTRIAQLISRPQISLNSLWQVAGTAIESAFPDALIRAESIEQAEIQIKYQGYIAKERDMADRLSRLDHVPLPATLDYHTIPNLSIEARQKLNKIKPETLGQASRISGVNPADISVLLIHLRR